MDAYFQKDREIHQTKIHFLFRIITSMSESVDEKHPVPNTNSITLEGNCEHGEHGEHGEMKSLGKISQEKCDENVSKDTLTNGDDGLEQQSKVFDHVLSAQNNVEHKVKDVDNCQVREQIMSDEEGKCTAERNFRIGANLTEYQV